MFCVLSFAASAAWGVKLGEGERHGVEHLKSTFLKNNCYGGNISSIFTIIDWKVSTALRQMLHRRLLHRRLLHSHLLHTTPAPYDICSIRHLLHTTFAPYNAHVICSIRQLLHIMPTSFAPYDNYSMLCLRHLLHTTFAPYDICSI